MGARHWRRIDHYSYLIDRQHRFLLIGIILLVIAVVFTLAGESLERYGSIVSRAEEPKRFWWNVATFYLGGIFFIALYLYKISN
jgi:H+/Cl- antiporter ClcA